MYNKGISINQWSHTVNQGHPRQRMAFLFVPICLITLILSINL